MTTIQLANIPEIVHSGMRVITTELLARLYGADAKLIRNNYLRNSNRFEAGKHFFKVEGESLLALKKNTSLRGVVQKGAKHVILWTERGAARHAKMLETDQAWDVFEALEDNYFNNRSRRSSAQDRLPMQHKVLDISVDRRVSATVVQANVNRYMGVRRSRYASMLQLEDGLGLCDRYLSYTESPEDERRISDNHAAMYGESRQLSLLNMSLPQIAGDHNQDKGKR